jgi:hypothetical protein
MPQRAPVYIYISRVSCLVVVGGGGVRGRTACAVR